MSAIFAQRLTGPLASLDVTWRHVHVMLKSQHTRDWCILSWSMVVQFGTPNVYFFNMNQKLVHSTVFSSLVLSLLPKNNLFIEHNY